MGNGHWKCSCGTAVWPQTFLCRWAGCTPRWVGITSPPVSPLTKLKHGNLSPSFPGRSGMASACVAFRPMYKYPDWARRAPVHSDVELEGIHCSVCWILPFPHHSLSALFIHLLLSSSFHTTAQELEYYILHSQNCFQFWFSLFSLQWKKTIKKSFLDIQTSEEWHYDTLILPF